VEDELVSPEAVIATWWALFGGTHLVFSWGPVRRALIGRLSLRGFKGAYSIVALVTLVGLFWSYFAAKHSGTMLFERTYAARHVTELVMLFSVLLLSFAHAFHSPATTRADMSGDRPSAPTGIHRITRHPQNAAFALFGLAHMLVNTTVGDWIFWGGFPLFAIVGSIHQDRRTLASDFPEVRSFYEQTSFIPFWAILSGKQKIVWSEFRWRTLAIGLALYAALRLIHPFVMGGFNN
jgi:uncharacterized membrane protein